MSFFFWFSNCIFKTLRKSFWIFGYLFFSFNCGSIHKTSGHPVLCSWLDNLGFFAINKARLQYLWIINVFMEIHHWERHLQGIILYNSHFKNDRDELFLFLHSMRTERPQWFAGIDRVNANYKLVPIFPPGDWTSHSNCFIHCDCKSTKIMAG